MVCTLTVVFYSFPCLRKGKYVPFTKSTSWMFASTIKVNTVINNEIDPQNLALSVQSLVQFIQIILLTDTNKVL